MATTRRPRVAGIVCVLSLVAIASVRPGAQGGAEPALAPALDRALAANDLTKARRLVPEDWAASEQLFVSYLERAYLPVNPTRRAENARTRAGRLADVFFAIIEYDFAKSIVADMDTGNA